MLLAVADADCRFIAVDIGDFGSNSDGGVFRRSVLGQRLTDDCLKKRGGILRLGFSIQYRLVTDGRTERRTDG